MNAKLKEMPTVKNQYNEYIKLYITKAIKL